MSLFEHVHNGWPGTIDGTALHSQCWTVTNLAKVPQDAPKSDHNVKLYGVPGSLSRPLVEDQTTFDLECLIHGNCDPDGNDYVDAEAGLETNKELWRAAFYLPTGDADGSLEMTVLKRNGVTLAGLVQPKPPIWGDGDFECPFTMSIVIARGCLLPVGGP